MKRFHLFEFEDLSWFPNWIRKCMTRYLVTIHRLMDSDQLLADLVARTLKHSGTLNILDLCSGSGGPMIDVATILRKEKGFKNLKLTLSDLYPNLEAAKKLNNQKTPYLSYLTEPVNAADVNSRQEGLRTMICSLHHMKPNIARSILKDAKEDHQPICIFEISDNSYPVWIWWISIPVGFIMTLFITPMVRPMSWQQIIFTYLIPILPLCIAWDGAVSNARTYTLSDLDELLEGLHSDNYQWEKGTLPGKGGPKLYLLGLPKI